MGIDLERTEALFRELVTPPQSAIAAFTPENFIQMTVFRRGKHGDQVDSTAQFFDWFKARMPCSRFFELIHQQALGLEQPRIPPRTGAFDDTPSATHD